MESQDWLKIVGIAFVIGFVLATIFFLLGGQIKGLQVGPVEIEMPTYQPEPAISATSSSRSLSSVNYGSMLYEEEFNESTSTWKIAGESYIQDGNYVVAPGAAPFPVQDTEYDDFVFEMDFNYLDPIPVAYLGIYFRETICEDKLCGYQFWLASDGSCGAKRYVGPETTAILLPATVANSIQPSESNTISILAQGSETEIYLNGVSVGTFRDSTYGRGKFHFDAAVGPIALDSIRIYGLR
jgi:hypothetical protein